MQAPKLSMVRDCASSEGAVRRRVHLQQQPIRPGGDRRQAHRLDQVPLPGAVAGVDDHREVGQALDQGMAERSRVFRVAVSNVLIPRSHMITCMLPWAMMCSAP